MDEKYINIAKNALDEKFGENITILKLSEISSITDYFIITNGKNANQINSMADEVTLKLKEAGVNLIHSEGHSTNWVLLDFGFIIIHIFDKQTREFFNLERIWGDAEVVR